MGLDVTPGNPRNITWTRHFPGATLPLADLYRPMAARAVHAPPPVPCGCPYAALSVRKLIVDSTGRRVGVQITLSSTEFEQSVVRPQQI